MKSIKNQAGELHFIIPLDYLPVNLANEKTNDLFSELNILLLLLYNVWHSRDQAKSNRQME